MYYVERCMTYARAENMIFCAILEITEIIFLINEYWIGNTLRRETARRFV